MAKRNQNTIGLDLRPEAKRKPQQDRTRNVNVPRFRNVHKMHLMDIKIDRDSSRDRARGQQRSGEKGRLQVADCERLPPTNLVRSDIFIPIYS